MSSEAKRKEAARAVEAEEEADAAPAPAARKWFAPRTVLLAAGAVLLLGAGGVAGALHFGLIGADGVAPAKASSAYYYDLPEMVVNLSASEQRAHYLKVKIALELEDQNVQQALEPVMPRILDMFQLYLRELRASDLDGSAGIFRLKEELLRRINLELHPNRIRRVLFKEIIVQ